MVKTVTLKGYLASELPEDARRRVLEEHRYINVDCDWWDFILDDFVSRMERECGFFLEKEKIEFDLNRGGYIRYRGDFEIDAHVDAIETLKEIYKRIDEAAVIDPEAARKIKRAVDDMEIRYEHIYDGAAVKYSDIYDEEEGWVDPFEKLASILDDESCINLPEHLIDELNGILKEELRNLLNTLREEFRYLISDEAVIETLDANGFLFTENSERIPASIRQPGNASREAS